MIIKNLSVSECMPQIRQIISYLNAATDRTGSSKFEDTSIRHQNLIVDRINEGYKFEDFKHVINVKRQEWYRDYKMSKYLRPVTLFGNKFKKYLKQRPLSEQ